MAVAGLDTHKDTLAVAVIDQQARELDRLEVENSANGHHRLVGSLRKFDVVRVGIEGSGSYGRGVALALQGAGFDVVEVPPQLTAQARRRQRSNAKSDPIDALLIARITLREPELPANDRTATSRISGCWCATGESCGRSGTGRPTGSTPTWCSSARATSVGSAG